MEAKAAQIILHEPVRFWIPTKGLLKLLRIRRIPFFIYPLHPGTMIKISGQLNKLINADQDEFNAYPIKAGYELIGQNAKTMSLLVSYAILNTWWGILFFSRPMAFFLHWRVSNSDLEKIMGIVLVQTDIKPFMNTIIYLRGLNVLSPKTEAGMSQNITRETIARGDSSEEQLNTSGSVGTSAYGA